MLKRLWTAIYKTDGFAHFAGYVMLLYLRFVFATSRKGYDGYHNAEKIWHDDCGIILCFWHSRLLMTMFAEKPHNKRQIYVLTTRHRDGRYTAAMLRKLRALPIYGSSSFRSQASLKESVRRLREGGVLIVTPDGPRGPAFEAAPGSVKMSELSDAWILPIAFSATRRRIFSSWDGLMWPYPFGRLRFCFGEAFKAKEFSDNESCRLHLQNLLNQVTERADKVC